MSSPAMANISLEQIRNIGISAHIDSGKTTLTERILFYTGRIHAIHEVRGKDGVGAKMDSMELEREKGITIQSAATYCLWNGSQKQLNEFNVNIIDTPGHVDFTIEVERALRVLDGAILVLDSGKGVQSQSITVDRQMKRYSVPRIAFVNKMDNPGADYERVAEMLREKLGHHPVVIQVAMGAEDKFAGIIDAVTQRAYFFDGEDGDIIREEDVPAEYVEKTKAIHDKIIEDVAEIDDELADKFLGGEDISVDELKAAIRRGTLSLEMTPVMCGSAFRNKGVQLLLDAVCDYLPNPMETKHEAFDQDVDEKMVALTPDPDQPLVGLAFKLTQDKYGQLTYFRIYQGTVKTGDTLINTSNQQRKVRIPRMFRMHSEEREEIPSAGPGDIVAFYGVDCSSGETFTDGKLNVTLTSMHVPAAVISLAVRPTDRSGEQKFSKALNRFTKEDPTFRVHQDEESNETIISGMGELHLEIYMERMRREYDCEVIAGKPQVAYREAITQRGEFNYTHKKQTGGSGQFAKVGGYIEPLPDDSVEDYEFVDDISGGIIPREYIPACNKGFQEAARKGSLAGFPVVRVRCVLNDGSFHAVDSSEMAFKTAALMAFREGFSRCKPCILEPIMKVELEAPSEFQGTVVGMINQRRGMVSETKTEGAEFVCVADVPLNNMFGFATDLRSATQGKGGFTMEFTKYAQLPKLEQEELIKAEREKAAEEAAKK
ncbi:MAG: elongation factor G [Hyphomicrobiaceae bacterium]|jgi:elongation factor G